MGSWVLEGDCTLPEVRRRLLSTDAFVAGAANSNSRITLPSYVPPPCGPNTTTGLQTKVFTIMVAARGGGAECSNTTGESRTVACEAACPSGSCMQSPTVSGIISNFVGCSYLNGSSCTGPCPPAHMTTQSIQCINGQFVASPACPVPSELHSTVNVMKPRLGPNWPPP